MAKQLMINDNPNNKQNSKLKNQSHVKLSITIVMMMMNKKMKPQNKIHYTNYKLKSTTWNSPSIKLKFKDKNYEIN